MGETVTITYTYQVDPRDVKLENTVSVQNGEGEPVTANTATDVEARQDFTVEKKLAKVGETDYVSGSNVKVGDVLTYAITVANRGNTVLDGLPVSDTLNGAAIDLSKATLSGSETAKVADGKLSGVGIGETVTITYTYTVKATDVNLSNTATVDTKAENTTETDVEPKEAYSASKALRLVNGEAYRSDAKVAVGDELTYAITVVNEGNTVLDGLSVSDALNGTDIDLSKATLTGSETATFVDGKLSGVGVGETVTLSYTYEVQATDAKLENVATVGDVPITSTTTDTEVAEKPAWTVEKTVSGAKGTDGKAVVGDVLTYTVTVENTGNTGLSGLKLEDEFSVDEVVKNDALAWTEGNPAESFDLAQGKKKEFTATYTVQATDSNLSNTATVGGETATIPTAVEDEDAWTVEKTVEGASGADGKAEVGDELTYTVTVKNTGNTDLSGLKLEDDFSVDGVVNNDALTWTEGNPAEAFDLAQGEKKEFTATYTVQTTDNNLNNTATVNGVSSTSVTTSVVGKGAWTVEKTVSGATGADGRAEVGDELTYTVTVENTGNTGLSGLKLEDEFSVDGVVKNDALTWTDGSNSAESFGLAQGATKTFKATYTVQATDSNLSNTATVGGETATIPTAVEDKDAWTVEKTVEGATGADGTSAVVGDVLTYTVTVKNTGNTGLSGLKLEDEFSIDEVVNNDALTWAEGSDPTRAFDLDKGGTKTFTATYTVQATDKNLSNAANVGGQTATISTPVVSKEAYEASKTVSGASGADGKAVVGDVLTYTITVVNTGNTELNVELKDILNGEEYDLSEAKISGGALEGSALTVAYGETAMITYSYTVQPADVELNNSITVDGKKPDGGDVDATVTVVPTPAYEVSKTVTGTTGADGKAAVGDTLTYTITVKNTGNTVLNDLAVSDEMNGTAIDLSEATLNKPEGSSATFADGKLSGVGIGETATLRYTYKVKATDSKLANAAKVGDKTAATATEVTDHPSIGISKTITSAPANGTGYEPGETIAYDVVVTNNGNLELHDIKVTDPLTGMNEAIDSLLPGASETLNTRYVVTEADLLAANGYASSVTELQLDDEGGINTPLDSEPSKKLTNAATAEGVASNHAAVTATSSAEAPIADVTTGVSVVKIAKRDGAQIPETAEVPVGTAIAYEITVTNNGNVTTNQTIKDVFTLNGNAAAERELTLTSEGVPYDALKAFTIPPKQSKVFTASYTVQATDKTLFNLASVAGSDSSVTTNVADHPVLTVEKLADGTGHVGLKGEITYAITVTNSGNVSVNSIAVTDPKTGMKETIDSLAPGAHEAYTTTYTVQEADILAGAIENTATAAGAAPNGEPVTGSDTETVTHASSEPDPDDPDNPGKPVIDAPRAELTVKEVATADADLVGLKDKIKYTITVTNTGNVSVYNIAVTDNGNVSTYSIAATGNGPRLNQTIECLAPGEEWTYTMIYEVTEADILLGEIVETTTAAGTDPNGNPVTGSDTVMLADAPDPDEPDQPVIAQQKGELAVAERVTSAPANGKVYALNESIAFGITVRNAGNVTLNNVRVTDSLTGLNETIASLAPGEEQIFSTAHQLTEADILAGAIENTATGSGTAPNGTTVEGADSVSVTAIAPKNGHLTIRKRATSAPANGGTYALGETIRYRITATNDGNLTLTDVAVSDALTGNAGENAWTIEALAPGASESFTAEYVVGEDDILAGSVVNVATATAASSDPNVPPTIVTGRERDPMQAPAPSLFVEITSAQTGAVDLGETIDYTIIVLNNGNESVHDITVTDPLTGLEQSVGVLHPGESASVTAAYTVTEADILAGAVTNAATAAGIDPNGGAVTGSGTESLATAAKHSHLTISKSITSAVPKGQSGYDLGDAITYEIVVKSDGNLTATDIAVTDELTGNMGERAWMIESLAPGESETFTAEYRVTEADILAGSVVNVATATGASVAPDAPLTVYPGEAEVQTASESARLKISKSITSAVPEGQSGYDLGDTITYEIVVKNVGDLTASDITVTDELTGNVGERAWTIKSLAPGAHRAFTAEYKVTERDILAGSVVNVATATGASSDPDEPLKVNPGDAEVHTAVRTPGLAVTMDAPAGPLGVGDAIPYTIEATNTGNVTLSGVTVSDPLTGLTQRVGSMAPGASATVKTSYIATASDAAAGSVTNTATVTGSDPDGNPVTQSCSAVTAISQQQVTLTVNYWYGEVGGAIAAPSFSATYFAGAAYHVVSPIVAGYNPSRETVTGTITHDATFDVIYTPIPYTLAIHYVYEDGTMAATAYTDTLSIGDAYAVTSPVIEGYTASDAVVAGTMPGRNVTITVIYVSEATALLTGKRETSLHIGNVTMNAGECFE